AGVHGKRSIEAADAAELVEKRPEPVGVIGARGHRETLRLRGQCCQDARMGVAKAHCRIGAHHVDVTLAIGVPQIGPLAARQHDRQRRVVACAYAIFQSDEIHGLHSTATLLGAESDTLNMVGKPQRVTWKWWTWTSTSAVRERGHGGIGGRSATLNLCR